MQGREDCPSHLLGDVRAEPILKNCLQRFSFFSAHIGVQARNISAVILAIKEEKRAVFLSQEIFP